MSLELNEAQDRYESHQRKIANKSAEIDLLLSRERNRYAAALWRRLAHYMVAAWQSSKPAGLSWEQIAQKEDFSATPPPLPPTPTHNSLDLWVERL